MPLRERTNTQPPTAVNGYSKLCDNHGGSCSAIVNGESMRTYGCGANPGVDCDGVFGHGEVWVVKPLSVAHEGSISCVANAQRSRCQAKDCQKKNIKPHVGIVGLLLK